MIFSAAQYSGAGGRPTNEDSCLCLQKNGMFVAAVADGLGGHGGGEIASAAAMSELAARFEKLSALNRENILELFTQMNDAVLNKQDERLKMKTTAAVFLTDGKNTVFAHIGDSRIYHFRGGTIIYQSLDHSASQLAVAVGEIPPEGIRFHDDRSKLLRCLGNNGPIKPDIFVNDPVLLPGDALLLCTDGFWELITENEMQESLSGSVDPREWLNNMLESVEKKAPFDHDNYTAVAVYLH